MKIKADGSPCRKCAEVVERLERSQLLARIDRVVVADERDPDSEGMQLAGRYNVDWAPFFIVEDDTGGDRIYTSFFRFLKEVLGQDPRQEEETTEMMRQNRIWISFSALARPIAAACSRASSLRWRAHPVAPMPSRG